MKLLIATLLLSPSLSFACLNEESARAHFLEIAASVESGELNIAEAQTALDAMDETCATSFVPVHYSSKKTTTTNGYDSDVCRRKAAAQNIPAARMLDFLNDCAKDSSWQPKRGKNGYNGITIPDDATVEKLQRADR